MINEINFDNQNIQNLNKKPELKLSSAAFIPKSYDLNNPKFNDTNVNNFNTYNNINNFQIIYEKNKFDNEISNENTNFNISNLLKEKKAIKISLNTNVKNTISSIIEYLQEENNHTVFLTGLNFAISKVVLIAEIVKIKIRNLHQINTMDSLIANNSYNYYKEGDEGDIKRIPKFEIVLTKIEPFEKGSGYQKPLTEEEIKILSERYLEKTTQKIKEKIIRRDNLLAKKINKLRIIPKKRRRRTRILRIIKNKLTTTKRRNKEN